MALNYQILKKKPIITRNIDGISTSYYDLLPKSVMNTIMGSNEYTILVVNKYYVARPDLISLAAYGTDMYGDIICKINGISNPFELAEDTVLIIPSMSIFSRLIGKGLTPSSISEPSKENKNNTVSTNKSIGIDAPNTYKKKNNEKRSSNEQKETDKNYIIDYKTNMIYY